MRAFLPGLVGAAAVAATATLLSATANAEDRGTVVAMVTIESVEDVAVGYAFGAARSIEINRFVDEALGRSDHDTVSGMTADDGLVDAVETASTAAPSDPLSLETETSVGDEKVFAAPVAVSRPQRMAPSRTGVSSANRSLSANVGPVREIRVSQTTTSTIASGESRRILKNPLAMSVGAFR